MATRRVPDDARVRFRMYPHERRGRTVRGHVRGTRVEPDGTLAYRIWDGAGFRYLAREDFTVCRGRRR